MLDEGSEIRVLGASIEIRLVDCSVTNAGLQEAVVGVVGYENDMGNGVVKLQRLGMPNNSAMLVLP